MNPIIDEWILKAEGDYTVATREFRARKAPNYDAVCFHAQQCAEKYIKARLQKSGVAFAKTHNLVHLLNLTLGIEPLWEGMRTPLIVLNNYSVAFRYPGNFADKDSARDALNICKQIRHQARLSLGLPANM